MRGLAITVMFVVACEPSYNLVTCPDGETVCPAGWECPAEPGGACIDPDFEPAFCIGKADETPCIPMIGGVGACRGELCIPAECGDTMVNANEVCDPTTPIVGSCVGLAIGYDYGGLECNPDCSAVSEQRCGRIGWRSMGFSNVSAAVWARGNEAWAVAGEIYRYDGATWQMVHGALTPGWSWRTVAGTSASDVWIGGTDHVAHWDGAAWEETMIPGVSTPADPAAHVAAILIQGAEVLAAGQDRNLYAGIWRRTGGSWVLDPAPTLWAASINALHAAGGTLYGGGGDGFGVGLLWRHDGAAWVAAAAQPSFDVHTLAGTASNQLVVGGIDSVYQHQATIFDGATYAPIGLNSEVELFGDGAVAAGPNATTVVPYFGAPQNLTMRRPNNQQAQDLHWDATEQRLWAATITGVYAVDGSEWSETALTPAIQGFGVRGSTILFTHAEPGSGGGVDRISDAFGPAPSRENVIMGIGFAGKAVCGSAANLQVANDISVLHFVGAGTPVHMHTVPGPEILRDVECASGDDALAIGNGGLARYFSGTTWTTVNAPTTANLRSAVFVASGTFIVVGDRGEIWKFVRPAQWTPITSNTTGTLNAVDAIDEQHFVAVGDGGLVVRCDPACTAASPTTASWSSVAMNAIDDIVVVGSGSVAHFDGRAWNPVVLAGKTPKYVAGTKDAFWFGEAGKLDRLVRAVPW